MSDYDAVVIGTGTAGQTAAHELKASGLTVAVARMLRVTVLGHASVLEDLVDLLIDKKLILFTELPPAAQEKLRGRKQIRQKLGSADLMVDDVL